MPSAERKGVWWAFDARAEALAYLKATATATATATAMAMAMAMATAEARVGWGLCFGGNLWLAGDEDGVGYGCGFEGGEDVVDADDVGSGEDGGYVGCGGGVEAGSGWRGGSVVEGCDGFGEEAFAGSCGEDGELEALEGIEVGVEGVVLVADFAEGEAGIDDDAVTGDAGGGGVGDAFAEVVEDGGK